MDVSTHNLTSPDGTSRLAQDLYNDYMSVSECKKHLSMTCLAICFLDGVSNAVCLPHSQPYDALQASKLMQIYGQPRGVCSIPCQ